MQEDKIKCLRASYEEGEEQGTTGMYFSAGTYGSKDFPPETTLD